VELLEASFVLCKQGVAGSIPATSTNLIPALLKLAKISKLQKIETIAILRLAKGFS